MISKPEKIVKRIIKAVGVGQSVLVIGEWQEDLIKGIKEKQNALSFTEDGLEKLPFEDNTFTRIVTDYSLCDGRSLLQQASTAPNTFFYNEARRLLLPTGMIIISANCEDGIFDKIFNLFKREHIKEEGLKKIKPKILQNQIHDHDFLIDGYYGYPGGHLLMMAQIINKEVTTLFNTEKQETLIK